MKPKEVFEKRDRLTILDVRELDEWEAGRIAGAIFVPLARLPWSLDRVPRDRTVVAVCRSGVRSAEAVNYLRPLGYEAENLDGGMQSWAAEGLPFSRPDGQPGWIA